MEEDLFILTPPQQAAFLKLRKAFESCRKLNMFFYNNYSTLGVTDRDRVDGYDDDPSGILDGSDKGRNPYELRLPCNEWADDQHYFHPVIKKG